jgi:hypothetical protein
VRSGTVLKDVSLSELGRHTLALVGFAFLYSPFSTLRFQKQLQ